MLDPEEKKHLKNGVWLALIIVLILLIIKLLELNFHVDFSALGIVPHKATGIWGIVTAPFIHKDLLHLFNNIIPLFVAIIAINFFYARYSALILLIIYLSSGVLTWFIGNPGIHIGASGVVYGYLSFLFFASTFSKNKNMLGLTLLIIFLYGSLIWGIIPLRQEALISWETHLGGTISGFIMAILFRNQGLPEEKFEWEDEEENIDELTDDEINKLIEDKIRQKRNEKWMPWKRN